LQYAVAAETRILIELPECVCRCAIMRKNSQKKSKKNVKNVGKKVDTFRHMKYNE